MEINRCFALGSLAGLSFVLMFFTITRFFDEMNALNGVVMVFNWAATVGLCYLTDRASKAKGK